MWELDNCRDIVVDNLIINLIDDSFTSESECETDGI